MTAIKQKAVSSARHARNLRDYIEGKDAVLRATLNVIDERGWFREMAETRRAAGHDRPARRRGGEPCANTIAYHQVLAFLPDEADLNGGPLSPADCMAYANDYCAERYPNQQIAMALHKERCEDDGTERYAVHLFINRTDLATGKRLSEGRGQKAKRDRAETVRGLDARWGLRQLREGVRNSRVHARQPQRAGVEGRIARRAKERGRHPEDKSYKCNLRELCRIAADRAEGMDGFRALLSEWGVESELRGRRLIVRDADRPEREFDAQRLDRELSPGALQPRFLLNSGDAAMTKVKADLDAQGLGFADLAEARARYRAEASAARADYVKKLAAFDNRPGKSVPPFRPPRRPAVLANDPESARLGALALAKAESARASLLPDEAIAAARTRRKAPEQHREPSRPQQPQESRGKTR